MTLKLWEKQFLPDRAFVQVIILREASRLQFHSAHIGLPLNYPEIQQLRKLLIAAVVCATVLPDTLGRKSWANEISWNRNNLLWAILSFSFEKSYWQFDSIGQLDVELAFHQRCENPINVGMDWTSNFACYTFVIQLNGKKISTSCGIMAVVYKELKLFFVKGKKLFRLIWVYLSKLRPLVKKKLIKAVSHVEHSFSLTRSPGLSENKHYR